MMRGRTASISSRALIVAFATIVVFGLISLLLPLKAKPKPTDGQYLSPGEIAISADSHWLFIVCERSDEVRVVDARSGAVVKSVRVGHVPRGIALSPDGTHIYVTNSWDDTVTIIDSTTLAPVGMLRPGWEPTSVVTDTTGKTLFVANRLSNDVSVFDLENNQEIKRIAAGRGASYLASSPDGARIYCTHVYPNPGGNRQPPQSEITVIDTSHQTVVEREVLANVAGVFHLALSSNGRVGIAAQLRPKNLLPLAHVEHGWAFGNSLVLFGQDIGSPIQIPLDEIDGYFAMPFAVAFTPDNSKLYVSTSGSDSVTVISTSQLLNFAIAHRDSVSNDLSASANYVLTRIAVGKHPRGMVLAPDGKRLYVANHMDDTISVIDPVQDSIVSTIDLGRSAEITSQRHGEQIFYSARYAFQGQFGCANCHIDGTFDGLQWDLEPDGFGKDIVDNRSIEDLSGTEPFKWNGANPDLPTECGPRTEKYFYRSQSYDARELNDLVTFVFSIPLRPNRYRRPDGQFTPEQARGKAIFERARYKSGRPIPRHNRCSYCHSGPKFTSRRLAAVGTAKPTDRSEMFDVPHLTNIAYSAPYLHDGSAATLEDLWTKFNPNDAHGVTSDLNIQEILDLVEYLRTL